MYTFIFFTTNVVQCIYRVKLTENYYYRETRRTQYNDLE